MKNTKQILGLVALLCFNQQIIRTSNSRCPATCKVVVDSYNHGKHKNAVLKLLKKSSREIGHEGGNEEELANCEHSQIRGFPTHCKVLIKAGEVIGFTLFAKPFGTEGHIRVLVVSKQFRNMSFKKMLLDSAIATLKAEGAQYIIATVDKDCAGDAKFWIKQGFEIVKDPETGKVVSVADRDVSDPVSAKNARWMNGYILKNI